MAKILFLVLFLAIGGCTTAEFNLPPLAEPPSKIYRESYDKVWRATQLALKKYPIKLNNMDSGILETDWVRGDKLFAMPTETKPRAGLRYKLTLRIVKGKLDDKAATKVTCTKTIEVQRDFFSGPETVRSDGLEENTILYRIGRFVDIDRILTKSETPTTSASDTGDN